MLRIGVELSWSRILNNYFWVSLIILLVKNLQRKIRLRKTVKKATRCCWIASCGPARTHRGPVVRSMEVEVHGPAGWRFSSLLLEMGGKGSCGGVKRGWRMDRQFSAIRGKTTEMDDSVQRSRPAVGGQQLGTVSRWGSLWGYPNILHTEMPSFPSRRDVVLVVAHQGWYSALYWLELWVWILMWKDECQFEKNSSEIVIAIFFNVVKFRTSWYWWVTPSRWIDGLLQWCERQYSLFKVLTDHSGVTLIEIGKRKIVLITQILGKSRRLCVFLSEKEGIRLVKWTVDINVGMKTSPISIFYKEIQCPFRNWNGYNMN